MSILVVATLLCEGDGGEAGHCGTRGVDKRVREGGKEQERGLGEEAKAASSWGVQSAALKSRTMSGSSNLCTSES